jgi:hypothetical protein
VELVEVVVGGFGYAVEMAVGLVEVVGGAFGYAVEMAVGLVQVVGGGFGYTMEMVVEPHTLAVGGCLVCIASQRASLTPC